MNKYNNNKKNDNIIIKAMNITSVGAGVEDKSRHHRPVGRPKTCSKCVYMYISP